MTCHVHTRSAEKNFGYSFQGGFWTPNLTLVVWAVGIDDLWHDLILRTATTRGLEGSVFPEKLIQAEVLRVDSNK